MSDNFPIEGNVQQVEHASFWNAHIGIVECARPLPKTDPPPPNANHETITNGPEIVDFTPILEFVAALANRRLRPRGHLTADAKCTCNQHLPDPTFSFEPTTVFRTVAFVKFDRKIA
jgi:hypothetical protein